MRGKKVKLGDVLIKKNLRFKDVPDLKEPLVLGVTNNEGVVKSKVEAGQKIEDYYVINKGDFVYNPYRINVGSIGISDLEGITSLAYVVFNVDETRLNKYLLFKLLKSDFGLKEIIRNGRGSVRNALRFDDLARIELVIPSIEEQNAFIDDFKKKEEKLELLKTNYTYQLTQLENLNQAILQEAVQGKLVKQDPDDEPAGKLLKRIKAEKVKSGKKEKPLPPIKPEEIPFEIPENWVWCRLGEIMNVKSGKRIHAADYRKEGVPFLRSGEIGTLGRGEKLKSQLYISKEKYEDIKAKFGIPKEGDILIACIGGSIGNTWVVDNRTFYYKDGNLVLIESIPEVETNFLLTYLKSPFFWKNTILNATDSSYNALTIEKLKDTEFPLPPLSEQKQIVVEIEKQLAKTKQLKEHIISNQQATEQLLKALLHQAFEVEEIEKV